MPEHRTLNSQPVTGEHVKDTNVKLISLKVEFKIEKVKFKKERVFIAKISPVLRILKKNLFFSILKVLSISLNFHIQVTKDSLQIQMCKHYAQNLWKSFSIYVSLKAFWKGFKDFCVHLIQYIQELEKLTNLHLGMCMWTYT